MLRIFLGIDISLAFLIRCRRMCVDLLLVKFLAVLSDDYFVVLAWPHVLDVQQYASGRRQANALY